jgi:ribosome maturation protein Sdo1
MKKVILFNGEDEVIMTPEQIKEMGKGSAKELVSFFQATTVYRDVMKDLIRDNGKAILNVNDEVLTDLRIQMIEAGYQTISAELIEVFGEDTAAMIMADTYNAINLEKDGRTE